MSSAACCCCCCCCRDCLGHWQLLPLNYQSQRHESRSFSLPFSRCNQAGSEASRAEIEIHCLLHARAVQLTACASCCPPRHRLSLVSVPLPQPALLHCLLCRVLCPLGQPWRRLAKLNRYMCINICVYISSQICVFSSVSVGALSVA